MSLASSSSANSVSANTVQQLLVHAWMLSRRGLVPAAGPQLLSDASLVELWTCTRSLSRYWQRHLPDPATNEDDAGRSNWASFAYQVLAADLMFRVYATTACATHREGQGASPRPIFDQIIQHLAHPRWRLLELMTVQAGDIATVDLFRRRCERWTDLLIGPWIVKFGHAAYAYDPRRAWDYGEDSSMSPSSTWAETLLAPSFRSAFGGPESQTRLSGEGWLTILKHMSLATGSYGENTGAGLAVVTAAHADARLLPPETLAVNSSPAPGMLESSLRKLLSSGRAPAPE